MRRSDLLEQPKEVRIAVLVVMATLAVVIGYSGAASFYYSGNSHPTVMGLLEYLLKWGSVTAVVLLWIMVMIVVPDSRVRRSRGRWMRQNDDGEGSDPFLEGHFDMQSDEDGSTESTSYEMGGQFGSIDSFDSSISASTMFNPATGIEMDGAFDKAGNLFGHGFGE